MSCSSHYTDASSDLPKQSPVRMKNMLLPDSNSPINFSEQISFEKECNNNIVSSDGCPKTPTRPTTLSSENETTPTKCGTSDIEDDPLTPTANLKILADALSPELRLREMMQEKQAALASLDEEKSTQKIPRSASFEYESDVTDTPQAGSGGRKEKSLGRLCQRLEIELNPLETGGGVL